MKRILAFAILSCILSVAVIAQQVEVKRSDFSQLEMLFRSSQLKVSEVNLLGSTFNELSMSSSAPSNVAGMPALPEMTRLVEIPLCEGFNVEITSLKLDTIAGSTLGLSHEVVPAQPSRRKSDRSQARLVRNGQAYLTDAFQGGEFFEIEKVGVARNRNLARITYRPVRYNPVSNELIVVKSLEVTVRYANADVLATREMATRYNSGAYHTGMETLNELPSTKELSQAMAGPIHYLIVAHSSFRGQLDQFVSWKQRKGFIVTVGYTDDQNVGSSFNSIANYIKSFYTNATAQLPAPTYVLLVGDQEQIPTETSSEDGSTHVTDLRYFTWTTGDQIPDCHYGRFSAQNVAQLTPQIEKTLMYEQYTFADPSFLSNGVLIAGEDGGYTSDWAYRYADPAMDYAAKEYVKSSNGFNTVYYYKNNTDFAPTGVTVNGSSQTSATASQLRALYNQGVGFVNYSAHGDWNCWGTPSLTVSHVEAMTNSQKFGVFIGNCCLTNSFQKPTCLGEAFLRQGNYCGAVGYIGASDYTYWDDDFNWSVGVRQNVTNSSNPSYDANHLGMYDRLFHTHGESWANQYTTLGGMIMAGNLAVESSNSSRKLYYWEVYHLMGDPSVMPYLGEASVMNVQGLPNTFIVGSTNALNLTVPQFAYVAVKKSDGTLINAGFANAVGSINLQFPTISEPGEYEVAVTAQGYQPFFTTVIAVVADGPYVMVSNLTTSASLVAGGNASFNIELENVGNAATQDLSVEIIGESNHLLFSQNGQQTIANINPDATASHNAIVNGTVWSGVKDQTQTHVTVIVRWGTHWDQRSTRIFTFPVNAPDVKMESYSFQGTAEPNQNITVNIVERNNGHAPMTNATGTLVCPDPAFVVTSAPVQMGTLNVQGQASATYTIHCGDNLPDNCEIPIYHMVDNGVLHIVDTLKISLGTGLLEDFETGNFNSYPWEQDASYPWIMTNSPTDVYAGTFSARSYNFGSGGSNCTSQMSINWTSTVDDSISFYFKVSSEPNYDYFRFYIDNELMWVASGTSNTAWERYSHEIPAGTHNFVFAYEKDGSMNRGSDCAWIDNISLPVTGTIRNYVMDTICLGESYEMPNYTINTIDSVAGTYYYRDSTDNNLHFAMLTLVANPQLVITTDKDTIARGEGVLISVTGATTYQWNTGEIVSQFHAYPNETTTYIVEGRSGSCVATDSITITVIGSISIDQIEESHLLVYPNPTTHTLVVRNIPIQNATLKLYDMSGRMVRQWNVEGETMVLDLNVLNQGVYMLQCGEKMVKVVKR